MEAQQLLSALLSLPGLAVPPQVSPDGRWVAWSWFRVAPAASVWVAPTDGARPPLRLTEAPENTYLVSWAPDSGALIVEQDPSGSERVQLFRVVLDQPGRMEPLTEPTPPFFIRGGQLHSTGRWLVYGANFNFATGRTIEPTWIWRHDLERGERVALARPEQGAYVRPLLNRPGTHVLYTRKDRHPAGQQAWVVGIVGREDREILNFGDRTRVRPSWLPDGRRVLFLLEDGNERRLGLWDMATEKVRWLIDPGRTQHVEEAYVPFGSPYVVVLEVREARRRSFLLHLETGEELRHLEIPGNLVPLAPTPDGAWVGVYYQSRQPHDLVRFQLEKVHPRAFQSLSRVWERTPLRPADLVPAEDFRWRSSDGLPLQGWLYRAQGHPKGTVVHIHGGPTAHGEDRVQPLIQFLATSGFHVLDPNYRGSTGFGLAFQEKIKEDGWGGREQDDIKAGIEALLSAGIAVAGKVGVTGVSYGGYSAWYQLTRYPKLVAAAAPICGMTDLVVDYQTTRPDLRPYSAEMLGGTPDEAPERYRERSPIHFVAGIQGKVLIVQGLQDPNVTLENVRTVREALDAAGIPSEVLAFEDEGHGITRPKNLEVLYLTLAGFFARAFESG